jgi:hypothetical protein
METVALPEPDDMLTEIAIFMLNFVFRRIIMGIPAHYRVILVCLLSNNSIASKVPPGGLMHA